MEQKLNCQIQEIENGFLVTIIENKLVNTPEGLKPMSFPIPTYCSDYNAVCQHLKTSWPKKLL